MDNLELERFGCRAIGVYQHAIHFFGGHSQHFHVDVILMIRHVERVVSGRRRQTAWEHERIGFLVVEHDEGVGRFVKTHGLFVHRVQERAVNELVVNDPFVFGGERPDFERSHKSFAKQTRGRVGWKFVDVVVFDLEVTGGEQMVGPIRNQRGAARKLQNLGKVVGCGGVVKIHHFLKQRGRVRGVFASRTQDRPRVDAVVVSDLILVVHVHRDVLFNTFVMARTHQRRLSERRDERRAELNRRYVLKRTVAIPVLLRGQAHLLKRLCGRRVVDLFGVRIHHVKTFGAQFVRHGVVILGTFERVHFAERVVRGHIRIRRTGRRAQQSHIDLGVAYRGDFV